MIFYFKKLQTNSYEKSIVRKGKPTLILAFPRNRILDSRGCLEFIEFDASFPVTPKRIYFLSDIPAGQNRGLHAHKKLEQIIICLHGSLDIKFIHSTNEQSIRLSSISDGYYIPAGVWRELTNFSENTVVMVLASQHYDQSDYIFDLEEFRAWIKNKDEKSRNS
jgi:dTDP-4-dehydrorhamnose 3,5-epimerase-like enzyme